MTKLIIKITYIQITFFLTMILLFLPMGLIYASGKSDFIMKMVYFVQLFVYSLNILLCITNSGFKLKTSTKLYTIWGILLIVTTFLVEKNIHTIFRAVVYIMGAVSLIISIQYMVIHQRKDIFNMMFLIFTFFSILNTLSVLLFTDGLYNYSWQGATYWFGGKFTVFYMYYTWAALYFLKKRKINLFEWIILFAIGMFLCIRVDCSTGIACLLATCLLISFKKALQNIQPSLIIFSLIGIVIIMTSSNIFFENQYIQYVITEVLHRSSLMTGRVDIYTNFTEIIKGHWIIGAGYDNTLVKDATLKGYLNAQNGILNTITQTGLIGATIFLITVYQFLKEGKKYLKQSENTIIFIFLLGLFICSIVEISFNYYFLILLSLFSNNLSETS